MLTRKYSIGTNGFPDIRRHMGKLKPRAINSGISFCLLLPLAHQISHNYIDPGTGSLIIQALIASLVGGGYLVKTHWIKVKEFLSKLFSKPANRNG